MLFLSDDWDNNEIGQSQLTHMKAPVVEDLQFIDEDDNHDAIYLDPLTEYL